jgi:hypothetical protein
VVARLGVASAGRQWQVGRSSNWQAAVSQLLRPRLGHPRGSVVTGRRADRPDGVSVGCPARRTRFRGLPRHNRLFGAAGRTTPLDLGRRGRVFELAGRRRLFGLGRQIALFTLLALAGGTGPFDLPSGHCNLASGRLYLASGRLDLASGRFDLATRSALVAVVAAGARFGLAGRGCLVGLARRSGLIDLARCSRLFGVSKRGGPFGVPGPGAFVGVRRGCAVARVDCGGALGWAPHRLGSG